MSVRFFLVDPETGDTLSAAQALALFESKNVLALLSQLFGYNVTSVSAVHPNLLETAAQSKAHFHTRTPDCYVVSNFST